MPYFDRPGARLFYEDSGEGPPIIAAHGFLESAAYWTVTGVVGRLNFTHRVVSMDLRGHARTRCTDGADGFDAQTIGEDLEALADHLGLDRFHLLTHATGGMAAVRHAMRHSDRILSLMLTDASSRTSIGDPAGNETFAAILEHSAWADIRQTVAEMMSPFTFRFDVHPDPARLHELMRQIWESNDPTTVARFLRSFYSDPDPMVEGLRGITCPTLVLVGEYDKGMLRHSRLMAEEIPGAELVVLPGVGHMTALEDADATADALVAFLDQDVVRAREAG